jgi:HlyD family secretion protein
MDRRLPPTSPWRRWLLRAVLASALLLTLSLLVRQALPSTPRLSSSAQLATVRAGEFRDELLLRARVEPLKVVQLDAQESGRVEAVLVRDGEQVQAGALLYRLHSREQEQQLLQRSAEVAQQLANVAVQRSSLTSILAANRRERMQLQHALQEADQSLARQRELAARGFVSAAALETAERQQQLAARLLAQTTEDHLTEAQTRRESLAEMDRAVAGLQQGLALLARSREGWSARAPIAGRLSGFALQVGMSLRPGERLGRIEDLDGGLQLMAEADEFYLPRLRAGLGANSSLGPMRLQQVLPQVSGGKVRLALQWTNSPPPRELHAGQAIDLRLQLSEPKPALLLADGPGAQNRLYVREGSELQLRTVQLGRRAAGQVEVLAGLKAEDEVLISAPPPNEPQRIRLP